MVKFSSPATDLTIYLRNAIKFAQAKVTIFLNLILTISFPSLSSEGNVLDATKNQLVIRFHTVTKILPTFFDYLAQTRLLIIFRNKLPLPSANQ